MADDEPLPPYENPQVTENVIEGLAVVEAEVRNIREGRSPRSHLRIIGGPGTSVAGHALVYADTYTRSPEDETFSYARHGEDQMALLEKLEGFIATELLVEFIELRNRPAVGVMQTESEILDFKYPNYLRAVEEMKSRPLLFARLNFPFGDITMEFQEQADLAEDEFRALSEGTLQRDLERPLFAFEATNSDIWTTFLASIHWARDRVEPEVLRQVLRMAARVTA
jgi:hypothetical protein